MRRSLLQQGLKPALLIFVALLTLLWSQTTFAGVASFKLALGPGETLTQELRAPATGIAVAFHGTPATLEIQFSEHGSWSPWRPIEIDNDAYPWERHSSLVFTDDATAVRLRLTGRKAQPVVFTLHAISAEGRPARWEETASRRLPAAVIIPRWQWGADESLRVSNRGAREMQRIFETNDPFLADSIRNCDRRALLYPDEFREVNRKYTNDNGETLVWPIGYSRAISLIVVHHTAESSPAALARSDVERMRTIYEYHTIARGWGDIGYNFVVGPEGAIFEGRAGGDFAAGAHTYCNNVGTIGISLMGNFQTGKPSEKQLTALRWLLVYLSDKYDIDPYDRTIFHGKSTPTIVGHRDLGKTACPGEYSQELLPQLRISAKDRDLYRPLFSSVASPSSQNDAALMESPESISISMGERKELRLRFMNTGLDIWDDRTWLLGRGDPGLYLTEFRPHSFVAGFLRNPPVAPGEIGEFPVSFQGGLSEKEGTVTFTPIINNERRLVSSVATVAFRTAKGTPQFTFVTSSFPPLHKTGEDLTGTVKLLNSGSVPWERDTITELEFDLAGGGGEVSVLNHTERIAQGEQGSFHVRLHNVEEDGPYSRTLVPRFAEGSLLTGSAVVVRSRAEPIPAEVLLAGRLVPRSLGEGGSLGGGWAKAGLPTFAEATVGRPEIAFDSGLRLSSASSPSTAQDDSTIALGGSRERLGRVSRSDLAIIEALAGTELTLSPHEQAQVPIRIRSGESGLGKFQAIAPVVISHPTIVLRDEGSLRIRTMFRSPVALRRFQTTDRMLTVIAPRKEGDHTFSIGDLTFRLTVTEKGRSSIRKSVPRKLTRRTSGEEASERRLERRARILRLAPPDVQAPDSEPMIRIRLSYNKDNAILTSPVPLRLDSGLAPRGSAERSEGGPVHRSLGEGGTIIFEDGPVHLNMERAQCKATTANGQILAPVIRIFPTDGNAATTVMTIAKDTNRFRGTLECRVIDGALTLINDLPLETYLKGLAEEPDSEPFEKQRAFAIAARSYALFYVSSGQHKFPGKPYDGSDDPREFQAYGGVHFEERNPRWVEAVKDTAGQVLSWERKVIKAPYFSSDNGRTKSASEVWGWTNTPYLEAKDDPWCKGLQNWGHGVGMSGCGAKGQAEEGRTAEEILGYYYPGTRIVPIGKLEQ